MISKEKGEEKACEASEEVIYKIDVPANRYEKLLEENQIYYMIFFL